MSARNELYAYINELIENDTVINPGSAAAFKIGELIDRIEDQRSHHDAQIMRTLNDGCPDTERCTACHARSDAADRFDPYEHTLEGLSHKVTGQPVTL